MLDRVVHCFLHLIVKLSELSLAFLDQDWIRVVLGVE